MTKYQVNISKPVYKYYTYEIVAHNEDEATRLVREMLDAGEITGNDLYFCTDEPDYDVADDPAACTVVDAIEIYGEENENNDEDENKRPNKTRQ